MTILDALIWLTGAGALFIVSKAVEKWAWFQDLESETKQFLATVLATAVALIAYALQVYVPADFWVALTPWWTIAVGIVSMNYGLELFHKFDKSVSKT